MRAEIFVAGDTGSSDVVALLLRATRRAAAARGANVTTASRAHTEIADHPDACSGLETSLVARLERSVHSDQRERLDEHVAQCLPCARALRRLEAAERSFDRPPRVPLPTPVAGAVLTALLNAAPVVAMGGDPRAARAQAWQQLAGPEASTPSEGAPVAAAPDPTSNALPAPASESSPAPTPIADAVQGQPVATALGASATASREESDAARRVLPRRREPRPEAATLGALISDAWTVVGQRAGGARAGLVARARQLRMPMAAGNRSQRRPPPRPSAERDLQRAAVGIFVGVASAVAALTFGIASVSSRDSNAASDGGTPRLMRDTPVTSPSTTRSDAAARAERARAAQNAARRRAARAASARAARAASTRAAAVRRSKTTTASRSKSPKSAPVEESKSATPPATQSPRPAAPPPPPVANPKPKPKSPAPHSGDSRGGAFSVEGET